jgi:DNA-binding transcriptional MerR regulator
MAQALNLYTAQEAAAYLRVSMYTLRKIELMGLLVPNRLPGGNRRYTLEMLNEYLERTRVPEPSNP